MNTFCFMYIFPKNYQIYDKASITAANSFGLIGMPYLRNSVLLKHFLFPSRVYCDIYVHDCDGNVFRCLYCEALGAENLPEAAKKKLLLRFPDASIIKDSPARELRTEPGKTNRTELSGLIGAG